ncbi:NADH-quinone oxidoreductase subunit G [Nocardioidaceae bacterium]|nr:NADH-quinone oxidoreductase subunit G [Nocardioidaceae bacterium]
MTVTNDRTGKAVEAENLVTLTIDGIEVSVPKGTLVIRAAEQVGVEIPRFCDHPLLEPVGACRQCLVEVATPGRDGELQTMQGPPGRMKPQASCTIAATEGMVVNTHLSSEGAKKAQEGVLEFLLVNHPLDCPVCDKGGECPLQNQSLSHGTGESRFHENNGTKRTFPKPINISAQVLLDRERCVLCARCTRFSEQIAGDPFIALVERGALQQVGIYEQQPFESYWSGNTIQICPVGALTSADYRFRSRPFDLVSTPSVGEHDACGAALRTDHRRFKVMRRLSGLDADVNEEWCSDKDRFAFRYAMGEDRLTRPMVRDTDTGELRVASWAEAFHVAAKGLERAGAVGLLPGGRLTAEDALAWSAFARIGLGTNDIDFRARPHSAEETEFLGSVVVGRRDVDYAALEGARTVVLAGLEPEDEAGLIFLRLRKAAKKGTSVWSISSHTTRGMEKASTRLIPTRPGDEAQVLATLDTAEQHDQVVLDEGAVILVGERLAGVPGALSAAAALAERTGARLAWVPRRAGDRGALEAGCLPTLLPGGRPVGDVQARVDAAAAWGVDTLPETPGRDGEAILAALREGVLKGLVIGGVDPVDLADPAGARAAIDAAEFVVSLELRASEVTERADVVLPVAPVAEKAGTFVTWEGRTRPFDAVMAKPSAMPDTRVLAGISEEMGRSIGFRTTDQARTRLLDFTDWDGDRLPAPRHEPGTAPRETVVLASWKQMIDDGRMQDGEEHLRATARRPVAVVSAATAKAHGLAEGDPVTITSDRGAVTLPVLLAPEAADDMVWAPAHSGGTAVHSTVGPAGTPVRLERSTS